MMIGLIERLAMTTMAGVLPSPRKVKRTVIGYAIIGLFGLTAYVAVIVGGALYVAERSGPVEAAFLVAAIAIASALIALAVLAYLDRRARIEAMLMRSRAASMQNQMLGALYPALPQLVRQSPIASAVMVASLAYAATRASGLGRRS